ncbi:Uncharacterized protein APZ42_020681 [Daphnia magna]|uniref:Uncharacterized protein n=1 Tax=Daphnia magna TaxID=35525 RepID=A0A164XA11_9CRUS|nr:Uncharacterized protein APZ42_020681 [Daphnia magna]
MDCYGIGISDAASMNKRNLQFTGYAETKFCVIASTLSHWPHHHSPIFEK